MSPSLPVILAAGEPSYTPSQYMPSVVVEIAFTATYATPAASRVWTDVTSYCELHDLITIGVGRQDERSTADANRLTLTLDNTDGRFTALRSASPYYPNVKVGRPIRVSATTVTGVASIRFVGFIDEWPVEWDGTDAYAKATVTASSRMSRLGLTAKLRSMIEQEILLDGPDAYYVFGEASEAPSASDSSGTSQPALAPTGTGTAVVFGNATGPAADGLTAAEFAGGQYLSTSGLSCGGMTIEAFVRAPSAPTAQATVLEARGDAAGLATTFGLYVRTDGKLEAFFNGPLVGATNVADGETHHVAVQLGSGSSVSIYLDGVLDASNANITFAATYSSLAVGSGFTGTISHVSVNPDSISGTRIAAHADAGLTGFAGDTTSERLLQILAWAGVASTEVDAETGVETMTYQQTSGQSVVDALRDVESTEGGVLFDGADGDVKFHNRSRRYLATAAATLDMASQHVGADYAPRLDRSTLVNDVTVENPTTGETARSVDTASLDEYGIATGSVSVLADSYGPLPQRASWHIASYSEPHIRVPSLTVDVLAHVGLTPSAEDLLGIAVGSLLAVTNAPTQSDTTSPSYFVEGYTETIGPESYSIIFNLSPSHPALSVGVYDEDAGARESRYDTLGSELASSVTSTATSLSVATTDGPTWGAADLPYDVNIGGEQITVTAIGGASSPQTFTVTRSVNGVVRAHDAATAVSLFKPVLYAL